MVNSTVSAVVLEAEDLRHQLAGNKQGQHFGFPGWEVNVSSSNQEQYAAVATPTLQQRFPKLQSLELKDSSSFPTTDFMLQAFLDSCGDEALAALKQMDIKKCHYLGNVSLESIVRKCSNLVQFKCSRWVDTSALVWVAKLSKLQNLDLGDSQVDILSVEDSSLELVASAPSLKHLSLQRCVMISDAGVANLASRLSKQLTSLDLSGTRITGMELGSLSGLRVLKVSGCRSFSNAALRVVTSNTAIEDLTLTDTSITNSGLDVLTQVRPGHMGMSCVHASIWQGGMPL